MQTQALQILYEDNHLIAVNKRPSDIVQGDKTGDTPLSERVSDLLKERHNKPGKAFVGVVHRLDRPVSGVLLLAKTGKALGRMNELFRKGDILKTYWAVVENEPPELESNLLHYLVKHAKNNKSYLSPNRKEGYKEARLTYRFIGKTQNYSFLEIDLHTGRHHQIRAQFAAIGCPVKGDLKYGSKRSNMDASICLHARSISFIHPVRKTELNINAPPPDEALWQACAEMLT
ncbi:MAG: RluA family pseudouridine synthase [Flavobacteriales bacterium]